MREPKVNGYTDVRVNLQNRSDLYGKKPEMPTAARAVLIPEGIYQVRLADVQSFTNAFGKRIGLVFEVTEGEQAGTVLMESAALSANGKLADLVAGMGEMCGLSEDGLRGLVGRTCRIMVRHGATKAGTQYASIARTLR